MLMSVPSGCAKKNEQPTITANAQTKLTTQIVETNSIDVDAVAGASLTSARIVTAVKDCLEQASKQDKKKLD